MDRAGKILKLSFRFLSVFYFIITAFYFLKGTIGGGDELLFLGDLEIIREFGWYRAIEKNSCTSIYKSPGFIFLVLIFLSPQFT